MTALTIGQLAKQTGVSIETIRYYERRQLIPEPPRLPSGYRQYAVADIRLIKFIKRAQELGFSLTEIGELLPWRTQAEAACPQVRQQAEEKITELEARIVYLQRLKLLLTDLVEACRERQPAAHCPILLELDTV